MMKIILSFLIFIFFSTASLWSQFENIQYYQVTQRDGLSNNNVNSIIQDSKGFMWFGTTSGLCRYDGTNFLVFTHDVSDTNSILDSYIYEIYEDTSANLWITTKSGLNKFNREKGTFKSFDHYSFMEETDDVTWPVTMNPGQSGKLWISFLTGQILLFDIHTESYSKVTLAAGENIKIDNPVSAVHENELGELWVATLGDGLYQFDLTNNYRFIHHYKEYLNDIHGLSSNDVTFIYEDLFGEIWVATHYGLNRLYPGTGKNAYRTIKQYFHQQDDPNSLSHNGVVGMADDETGILWLRTANGVNTYNRETGHFRVWPYEDDGSFSWENFLSLRTLCMDNNGLIWFSIHSNGVSWFSFHKNNFKQIQNEPDNDNSLRINDVSGIYQDTTGELWAGIWAFGLNRRIPGKHANDPATWQYYTHDPSDPNSLNNNNVRGITRDSKGRLWIGTMGGGMNKFIEGRNGKGRFVAFKPDTIEVPFKNTIDIIQENPSGNLWLGAATGFYLFIPEEEAFYRYVADIHNPDSLPIGGVNAIAQDPSGIVWVSSWNGGLYKIIPPIERRGRFITGAKTASYRYHNGMPNELGDWQVLSILVPREHSQVKLWIGTQGAGLFGLKSQKDEKGEPKEYFIRYSESEGLSDNSVQGIEEDNNGNLWLSTLNGLSRFNPETEVFVNYFEEDGISSNAFLWLAHYKDSSGDLYFSNNGILHFNPDSISWNKKIPPVYITGIKVSNVLLKPGDDSPLQRDITETRELILSHEQNNIGLEFAALNYIKTEKNKYKYKLEGLEKEWVAAGTRTSANYIGLQPGTYTFKVIGSNNDGVWNKQGTSLKIIIKPPWWKSVPAIFAYILLIILAFYGFVKIRERKLMHDNKRLEHMVEERTEELQQTLDYLKETQAQLVQSEKMASIGQLTAGIAHEINNPVNYINAGIDSLKISMQEIGKILDLYRSINRENLDEMLKTIQIEEEKIDMEETRKEIRNLIQSVTNGTERTTEIVKGLRTFSRLDENELKPADIHEGIDLTLVMLHNKYKDHVDISKDYGEIPLVECFPGQLNQVFMNILSNAIEAIPEKGTITIKTWEDSAANKVFISIKDSGEGMSENTLKNIFNPFFTTKEVGKGTGLGLSISHGIIKQHKGKIEVKSKPGEGSEFIISLPIKQD